jgi:S1-C subfamily serine protease
MNRRLNNFIAVLLVLAFVAFAPFFLCEEGCATAPSAEVRVKAATHTIGTKTFVEESICSATAIGRHAILTASHCEAPSEELSIDLVPGFKIDKILRDGNDHSILLIANADFEKFVPLGIPRELHPGEPVFIWGNPSYQGVVYLIQLRKGKYRASHTLKSKFVDILDFVGHEGDSGAAVFSEAGEILGVVTFVGQIPVPPKGEVIPASGAVRLAFTKTQLDTAASFK